MTRYSATGGESRRGIAAVELALMLPLLVFLLVASIDFARVFYFGMLLDGCARNGAIYGQLSPYDPVSSFADLQSASLADATVLTPAPTVTACYGASASGPFSSTASTGANYIQVTVSWSFSTLVRYPGIPSQTTLTRACVMAMPPATPASS